MAAKNKKVITSDVGSELFDELDRFEHFFITYWKQIVFFCVLLVVIVAAVAAGYSIKVSRQNKADSTIASANTVEDLAKVINDYQGNPAVNVASVKLARIYVNNKDYDKALQQYQKIAASDAPDEIRLRAKLNSCYVMELQGALEKAAGAFAEIGSSSLYPPSIRSEANYSAGRIYADLKNYQKAEEYLNAVAPSQSEKADISAHFWAGQSKQLMERVKKSLSKTEQKG